MCSIFKLAYLSVAFAFIEWQKNIEESLSLRNNYFGTLEVYANGKQ